MLQNLRAFYFIELQKKKEALFHFYFAGNRTFKHYFFGPHMFQNIISLPRIFQFLKIRLFSTTFNRLTLLDLVFAYTHFVHLNHEDEHCPKLHTSFGLFIPNG